MMEEQEDICYLVLYRIDNVTRITAEVLNASFTQLTLCNRLLTTASTQEVYGLHINWQVHCEGYGFI
jgi:hypothetical protein